MKTVLEIWEDFIKGDISIKAADKLMQATIKEDEKQVVKHIPGRYEKYPFWFIDYGDEGSVKESDYHTRIIKPPRILGDCCKTKEEAECIYRQQKAYLTLIDKIFELNEGWTPDWKDHNEAKYYFCFDHDSEQIGYQTAYFIQPMKDELYFKEGVYGQVIKELGAELITLAIGI